MSLRFLVESHYASVRTDAEFWRPHVAEIARRHALAMETYETMRGDATNPVFLVGDSVVKIYTPYFHGRETKGMEVAALEALRNDSGIPVPKVLARGELLFDSSDWNWPYVVMSRMDGRVLQEDWATLDDATKEKLLGELGAKLRRIHGITPTPDLAAAWKSHWPRGFDEFLTRQLDALLGHADIALLSIADELRSISVTGMGPSWPVLLHGDIEPDHLFVSDDRIVGIIDFGDAKIGDPLYDFFTIRQDLAPTPELRAAFLQGYGLDPSRENDLLKRLTVYAMLHEWTTLRDVIGWTTKSRAKSIRELGEWLWA
ncbi:MAG: phosphotransferase [Methanoregulaceae archaeon]|nr:phosphotransferase [Methanoregulaceae archaeon]